MTLILYLIGPESTEDYLHANNPVSIRELTNTIAYYTKEIFMLLKNNLK